MSKHQTTRKRCLDLTKQVLGHLDDAGRRCNILEILYTENSEVLVQCFQTAQLLLNELILYIEKIQEIQ
jgi:hypothetical protein